ncbi:hypothetical protein AV540_05935 [Brevibacillus parabrevis]|nr:hypothetical protein AV540_05935 [Brevibacillus parabrevis]
MLRKVADYFGRTEQAEEQIAAYEAKARRARRDLQGIADKQSVACLRISADHIFCTQMQKKVSAALYCIVIWGCIRIGNTLVLLRRSMHRWSA